MARRIQKRLRRKGRMRVGNEERINEEVPERRNIDMGGNNDVLGGR